MTFVCFSTPTIHLELVCECTSIAFLNALKRFISRRGKPSDIYSDNGTNFVGTNRELRELKELFDNQQFQNKIINELSKENINWHFIPPRAK